MIDWNEIRKRFPVTERLAYLNSAAAGPVSVASQAAAAGYYEKMMRDGDVHWNRWLADREAVRKRVAQYINAEPEEIAFTPNTSQGIDVKQMKIDALCATGHKWLLSGYGSGFVYLSRDVLAQSMPRSISWLSVEDPFAMRNDEFRPRHDAAAGVELGCPHFAGIFSLGASLDLIGEIGAENIQARVLKLNRFATSRLKEDGWKVLSPLQSESSRSAETLVEVDEPGRVVRQLLSRGVIVTEKPRGIRVATHFFNNEEDVERLIAGLKETRASFV